MKKTTYRIKWIADERNKYGGFTAIEDSTLIDARNEKRALAIFNALTIEEIGENPRNIRITEVR